MSIEFPTRWNYDPKNVNPIEGAPSFFKRVWQGLVIYGWAQKSYYPEDARQEKFAWENNRSFLSVCFSIVEPEGELGFTRVDAVKEITKEEFMEAAKNDWPNDA